MSKKGKNAIFQFENFVVRESHIVINKGESDQFSLNLDPKGAIFKDMNQFHLSLDVDITDGAGINISLKTISIFSFPKSAVLEVISLSMLPQ